MKTKPLLMILVLIALIGIGVWTSQKESHSARENPKPTESFQPVNGNGQTGLKPGNTLPDAALTSLEGKTVSLKEFRGKKVILNFWATWCPPCRKEMPDMQKMYSRHKDDQLEIVAINLRYTEKSTEAVSDYVEHRKASFPVLLDREGKVSKKFQAVSLPTSYLIDSNGVVQKKIIGALSPSLMSEFIKRSK
ncbi:TlpA disulfide reductase family protein [Fictibacillus enclensis]|uniref:TlpA disulfide reductase family protein n=1 Tax=Fictibacillus enclensis TaxID=1017270 RepID=UPI0025A28012|nr:TlpA disulfide reductase family protein [Fictibacillus enclensis]MDM5336916.1 TlpA disulfide reductase family protein [Fictibacillus enclensis]